MEPQRIMWIIAVVFFLALSFYVEPFLTEAPRWAITDETTRRTVIDLFQVGFSGLGIFAMWKGFFSEF